MARSMLVGLWLLSSALPAQERLRVQGPSPATVVLGSSARVDLVVEGRGADPKTPQPPRVDGLDLRLSGPSRQSFTSITPSGMVEQVTVSWQLLITPLREGSFTVPSFVMQTGSREQRVPELKLSAVKELRGAEFGYLDVRVEPRRVYVHEPIRVRVEFGVDKSLRLVQGVAQNRTRYYDVETQAAWMSEWDGAEPLPEPEPSGDKAPVVLNQTLQYAEYDSAHQRGGRAYNSFVFEKSFLPTRPGKKRLDAPLLRYHVQTQQGRRGVFGELIGGESQNYYVYGEPIEVEVLPIPEAGRPQPYYGAVGRFRITTELDKDTVKVGNSVKLTLRIEGAGNFEFLRAPDLSAWESRGLHLLGQNERRSADAAVFVYDLTPLSADVTEAPSLSWNWFDTTPGVERFVEQSTKALPLRVEPLADGESLLPLADSVRKAVTPGVDDIFDLPSLDGGALVRQTPSWAWRWLAALLPWAVLGLGVAFSAFLRRRARDPGRLRAQRALGRCRAALAGGADPGEALCGYLADRMDIQAAAVIGADLGQRLAAHGLSPELAAECVRLLEAAVASRYGGGGSVDAQAVLALVQRVDRAGLGRQRKGAATARGLACLLGALALCGSAPLAAQSQAGVEFYRRGDYAAAAAAFEAEIQVRDDGRLWFALGNCRYRLGQLPRALWAYEKALRSMPRDAELRQNRSLVRRQLGLDDGGEDFAAALASLSERLLPDEQAALCFLFMALSALLLWRSRRSVVCRWLGLLALAPGALLALEILWLAPNRPARAIALEPLELSAEPRAGLQPVARAAAGAELRLAAGSGGEWVRLEAEGRTGYVPRAKVGLVE